MGKGAGPVGPNGEFGSGFSVLEDAVQGFHVAGAFDGQLIGHRVLGVCGEGGGALADVLSLALQVLIQHVAAERGEVLLGSFGRRLKTL